MNTGKIIAGIIASVAVGAVIGIIFAPHKGDLTRKKIAQKNKEFSKDQQKKFNALMAGATEKYHAFSKQVDVLAKAGAEKTAQLVKEISDNGHKSK